MNKVLLFILLLGTIIALREPVFTIHYLRSYRPDLIQKNFGCEKSIVYGTYLYPMGPVDALYALLNPHTYSGLNANCHRSETYIKLFGDDQEYEQLMGNPADVVKNIYNKIGRLSARQKVIVDWKYLPESGELRTKGRNVLEDIVVGLRNNGLEVYVKAPASYFCLNVDGKKYILDLSAHALIVELYGE